MYNYINFDNFKNKGILATDPFDVWALKCNGVIRAIEEISDRDTTLTVDDSGNVSVTKNLRILGSVSYGNSASTDLINDVSVDTTSVSEKSILRYSEEDESWVAGDHIPKSIRKSFRGTTFVMNESFAYTGLGTDDIQAASVGVIVRSDADEDIDIIAIANFNITRNDVANSEILVDLSFSATQGTEVSANSTNMPMWLGGSWDPLFARSGKKRIVSSFTLKNRNDNPNPLNIRFGPSGITGITENSYIRTSVPGEADAAGVSWDEITSRGDTSTNQHTSPKIILIASRPVTFEIAPVV